VSHTFIERKAFVEILSHMFYLTFICETHVKNAFRLFSVGLPLPNTERPDGPRFILIRPGAYDASIYTVAEMIKISNMIQDILMNEGKLF
jgi:hypothetical protein